MKKTIGLAAILALVMVGCGGGGGSDGTPGTAQQTSPSITNTASTIYNECTDPTGMNLPTGYNSRMVYTMLSAGNAISEMVSESLINGPAVFEGQNAIQATFTHTINTLATATTPASTTVGRDVSYTKIQNNGLAVLLGSEYESTTSGFTLGGATTPSITTKSKDIYSNEESAKYLTLKLGESITVQTIGTRTNTTVPIGNIPSTTTTTPINYSTNYTYVAREIVNVLGRNFDTCKYTTTGDEVLQTVHMWLLVGNGTMVKQELLFADGNRFEYQLKSGTYNGVAL